MVGEKFLAHKSEDEREQTLQDHLEGAADLCAGFAAAFGAEDGLLDWPTTWGNILLPSSAGFRGAQSVWTTPLLGLRNAASWNRSAPLSP